MKKKDQWLKRGKKPKDISFIFDDYEGMMTLNVHHNGKFISNPKKQYVDEKVDYFDFIDLEVFGMSDMTEIMREVPKTALDDGLRPLLADMHVANMKKYVPKYKQIDVYVEHSSGIPLDHFDDALGSETIRQKPIRENVVNLEDREPVRDNVVVSEEEDGEEESESRSEWDDSEDGDFEPDKENDIGDDEDSEHVNEPVWENVRDEGSLQLEKEPPKDVEVNMKHFEFRFEPEVGEGVQGNEDVQGNEGVQGVQGQEAVQGLQDQELTPHIELNEEVLGIDFDDFDSGPDDDTLEGLRKKKLK
uniref:uncharacterized protein LOC122604312 n=1 Tax=Erigeron canadensis TaxID=72917 RepID=UPI001CB8FF21|nr:uncharacterized protein LOC122604312 [Erigeron canadensis]